ncbi:MAG: hypothetical protein HYU66_12290 [Armatimonadetes bacterium]|nr:hypothetical protein [Armatimonadota bacterium]
MAFHLCSVLALALPLAGRELHADRFGNVYTEREAVRLAVAAGEAGALAVEGLAGREILRRDLPAEAATVDLGTLPPGYYEAAAGERRLPFVVVVDPARRVPGESRLATDNAMSWLAKPEHFAGLAELLRRCGIGWVRERLSWGEVERERGKYDWGKYDQAATALADHGVKVYQVYHASPGWSRADHDGRAAPDDLRDVHRFARALARQFKGRVQAWEVWNEPDISFFRDPAGEMAAFQKAAFLGFRAEDPGQLVLGPSMAMGAGAFADHLLADGTGAYMDLWNYHVYADPSAYAGRHEGFAKLLPRHGLDLPMWVTEAGDPVQGPEGILTADNRKHQAAFLSRAFPLALAAGEDRHFWFIFPFYKEGLTGWGLFEPDQRVPYPAVAALSTVTWALGHGDYLGSLAVPEPAHALAFARGDGTAGVAVWRDNSTPAEVPLPLEAAQVSEAREHLGTPIATDARPSVARAAAYLIVKVSDLAGKLTPPPTRTPAQPLAPPPGLPAMVTRLRVNGLRPSKEVDAWIGDTNQPVAAVLEAYNFGADRARGELRLTLPAGWHAERTALPYDLLPGERLAVETTLTPPAEGYTAATLTLTAVSGAKSSAPSTALLRGDPNTVKPRAELPLDILQPEKWQKNLAAGGAMTSEAGPEGGLKLTFTFPAPADNWAYPGNLFDPPIDLSAWQGLRFEYRTSVADSGPVRVMVVEPGGTFYLSGGDTLPGSTSWRSGTVLFANMQPFGDDPKGHLDLQHVARLRFGANCKPLTLNLEIRNVRAIRLD